jgi:hypothetical protein
MTEPRWKDGVKDRIAYLERKLAAREERERQGYGGIRFVLATNDLRHEIRALRGLPHEDTYLDRGVSRSKNTQ